MYAIRGILVSFSIFVLVYGVLSLAVCTMWRRLRVHSYRRPQRRCADLLFALRMAPFVMAVAVTLVLAVPSFLLLEPRVERETMGTMPLLLGACGFAVMVAGIWNAAGAWMRASRMIAGWSRHAILLCSSRVDSQKAVSVLLSSGIAPPLTAAGILRPTVWLSRSAEFVLTGRELTSALRHEAVHVSRRDNLRKLLLRLVVFPGMTGLETAWSETTEMAADDAAVSNASEALDLAAAVIKLSRLALLQPPAELTTALVHSPAASVNARVERLIAWKEGCDNPRSGLPSGSALCAVMLAVTALVLTYGALLVRVHAATEWLVR